MKGIGYICILAFSAISLSFALYSQDPVFLPRIKSSSNEIILQKKAMTISLNKRLRVPNWVAYEMKASNLRGDSKREAEFRQDESVPREYRVSTFDYSRSGYDRGHMAPSADFRFSQDATRETFLMTNICPQNHELNGKSWNTLEKHCRRWARREGTLYVCVGPIFRSSRPKTIGEHKVAVPDAFFRVILSLRKGHEKAIGFIYENTSTRQRVSRKAVSVDEVEKVTGLDFFASLEDRLEDRLESSCSMREWPVEAED